MRNVAHARWTIIPKIAPRPWLACSGCGGHRAFRSSGKIRLNANGKRLDAWLIYRCLDCDKTWNRPLVERRDIRDIDPAVLEALHLSDPAWVRTQEFDINSLRRRALRIDEFADVDIAKEGPDPSAEADVTHIELTAMSPTCLRLDRLLAGELGMSRARLHSLYEQRKLRIDPDRKDMLRRRIKLGTHIVIEED